MKSALTKMGFWVATTSCVAMTIVGIVFLIRESRKKREERSKLYIVLGIVLSLIGSFLLLGIVILFVMSGLTHTIDPKYTKSVQTPLVRAPTLTANNKPVNKTTL